jgi:small ligand-binding sensory domain FIST
LGLIRTILGVNEADGSLTLAGDIDAQGYLKLMHASTDALVGGAETAAEMTRQMQANSGPGLAVLVSCVGRKLVMGGRVDEEVEAVASVFGAGTTLAGFYSNGEISPCGVAAECKLHNQTMTISYVSEAV